LGLNPLVQRVFKGVFDRNKTSFSFAFYARRCSPHRRPVREDGSGSVSAHIRGRVCSGRSCMRGAQVRRGCTEGVWAEAWVRGGGACRCWRAACVGRDPACNGAGACERCADGRVQGWSTRCVDCTAGRASVWISTIFAPF